MKNSKYKLVIPAAGRSSRSGLNYPKSLYRLNDIPILVRLCRKFDQYDSRPLIIINSENRRIFEDTLSEFCIQADFIFQDDPSGMGNALLEAEQFIEDDTQIILVWSDIPMLDDLTIKHLIDCHAVSGNHFSFVTALCESCYTIVVREKGDVKSVVETRAAGIAPGKDGERDIGLFVFKKNPLFSLLRQEGGITEVNGKKEKGFLYVIEKLVNNGLKVEGYPLASQADVLSFNTPEDLKEIESAIRQMNNK